MIKQKARHMALEDLAKKIMPNLLSDIKTESKKGKKGIPKKVEDEDEGDENHFHNDDDDDDDEKPRVVSMSLTRMVNSMPETKHWSQKKSGKVLRKGNKK